MDIKIKHKYDSESNFQTSTDYTQTLGSYLGWD